MDREEVGQPLVAVHRSDPPLGFRGIRPSDGNPQPAHTSLAGPASISLWCAELTGLSRPPLRAETWTSFPSRAPWRPVDFAEGGADPLPLVAEHGDVDGVGVGLHELVALGVELEALTDHQLTHPVVSSYQRSCRSMRTPSMMLNLDRLGGAVNPTSNAPCPDRLPDLGKKSRNEIWGRAECQPDLTADPNPQ
jgi:hypothetical protein